MAATYLAVRGDIKAVLSTKEVLVIAEKPFTSPFCQSLVLAKIVSAEIAEHDASRTLVIALLPQRPAQIQMRKSRRPSAIATTVGFDEIKPAKPSITIIAIFYLPGAGSGFCNLDGPNLSCELLCLLTDPSVELGHRPIEPVQIRDDD